MRRWLLPLLFILLTLPVLGLNVTIRDSCNAGEEALFSISNMTNAHAAEPGYYQGFTGPYGQDGKQVCARGVGNTEIINECDRISNPVLSFYNPGTGVSHLSPKEELNDQVLCARQLATSVWRNCPGGTEPIISIRSPVQAHVARPGYYDWQICGALFTNATLAYRFTLEGNRAFIANFETGENRTIETTTDRPGYVTVQNQSLITGLVGGGALPHTVALFNRSGRAVMNHTMNSGDAQWFVPLTTGTYYDIESRLDMIQNEQFLDVFNPNFAFDIAENILVRITLTFEDIDIVNSLHLGSGIHNLIITNQGTNTDGETQIRVNKTINAS